MSSIKSKTRKNDNDELSEYFQNAEIIICQESNATLEKTIRFKTRNNIKEKIFNHEFNKNDVVDYTTLVEKKWTKNKNLGIKRKY